MAKWDQKAHAKKANLQYREIVKEEGFDLKALMANVSTATKAKATKNAVAKKKLGKDKEAKVKELLLEESQVIEAEVKELAVETKQSKQYLKN